MSKKRVVAISDLHAGHRVGLTPPQWQSSGKDDKWRKVRKELWDFYQYQITALKPIDILFVAGDAIDGKATRSGGGELITADMNEQCEMAAQSIWLAEAENIVMVYGTPYHVGTDDDYEYLLSKIVKADKIGSHEWVDINGIVFDLKHHIGSSTIPHGRGTPLSKDRLWNLLWTEFNEQPKADILIRAHVHYHAFTGGSNWLAMTLPALQGQGSKYGGRRCSGHIDFGIVYFDVYDNGKYSWEAKICRASTQKASALKL